MKSWLKLIWPHSQHSAFQLSQTQPRPSRGHRDHAIAYGPYQRYTPEPILGQHPLRPLSQARKNVLATHHFWVQGRWIMQISRAATLCAFPRLSCCIQTRPKKFRPSLPFYTGIYPLCLDPFFPGWKQRKARPLHS